VATCLVYVDDDNDSVNAVGVTSAAKVPEGLEIPISCSV